MLLLLLLASPLEGQMRSEPVFASEVRSASQDQRPPLDTNHLVGQMLAGLGGGALGAIGTSLLFLPIMSSGDDDGWGSLGAIAAGLAIGYPVGAASGVYFASSRGNRTASLLSTFGGAAAGAILGGLIAQPTGGASYLLAVPLGAATGFNLTRRYRQAPAP